MNEGSGPIVTLDGPAGAGKSTTARAVATRLGFRHLDSGALYRALTLALIESALAEEEWDDLTESDMRALDVSLTATDVGFDVVVRGRVVREELRTPEVTSRVAHLASLAPTRACLLALQRAAGEHGRLIADGRDMGSVVFPGAAVKVYLVADLAERARRRLRDEGMAEPSALELERRSTSIAERDRHDSERTHSPLRMPDEAHLIDTTRLSFDEQVEAIVRLVESLQ